MERDSGTTLGKRIIELREKRGMTQRRAAKNIHVTENAFCSYELANHTPKPEILDRMARALQVRPDNLSTPELKRGPGVHLRPSGERQRARLHCYRD